MASWADPLGFTSEERAAVVVLQTQAGQQSSEGAQHTSTPQQRDPARFCSNSPGPDKDLKGREAVRRGGRNCSVLFRASVEPLKGCPGCVWVPQPLRCDISQAEETRLAGGGQRHLPDYLAFSPSCLLHLHLRAQVTEHLL